MGVVHQGCVVHCGAVRPLVAVMTGVAWIGRDCDSRSDSVVLVPPSTRSTTRHLQLVHEECCRSVVVSPGLAAVS